LTQTERTRPQKLAMDIPRPVRLQQLSIRLVTVVLVWGASAGSAHAVAIGPHAGVNLDVGSLHLGADLVLELADVSPNVKLAIWPSYAHVFIDDGHDVELFGVDFPFVFPLDSAVTPFVGPGLGLAFYGDTSLKVNLIGGLFFETGSAVRPFTELAVRLVNGTFVDLLAGVLFEL
jgi:hypothetical protein